MIEDTFKGNLMKQNSKLVTYFKNEEYILAVLVDYKENF